MSEAQMKAAFDECDADKSGKISCKELAKVLAALGYGEKSNEVAELMVKAMDKDGDGQVSWEEFKTALEKNPK